MLANVTNGTIGTIDLLLDHESLNNQVSITAFYTTVRGDRIHDTQPRVEMSILPSNLNIPVADSGYMVFPISHLNLTSLADCDKYKILQLQLNLVTLSIYQLGEHLIVMSGSIVNQSITMEFASQTVVDVETSTCE